MKNVRYLCFLFMFICSSIFAADVSIPDYIIKALGGQHVYDTLPILDIEDRVGHTGYIDFINPNELTAPIMKGTDKYKRPFIAFKWVDVATNKVYAQTFFQRYSDDTNRWQVGNCGADYCGKELFSGSGGLRPVVFEKFAMLVKGETITDPNGYGEEKLQARLVDEEKQEL